MKRLIALVLVAPIAAALLAACSGSSEKTGSYEEVCTACGSTWTVEARTSSSDELEVEITILNTGELGPLEIRGELVEAILFTGPIKEKWVEFYPEARAEGRLATAGLPRLRLVPAGDTILPARIEPQASWSGTFMGSKAPEGTEALIISFQSYFAPEKQGAPTGWTSRDARRPFINLGDEVVVAAVVTQTPVTGPREIAFLEAVKASFLEASSTPVTRYRFEIEPWVGRVDRVTVTPALPGSGTGGVVSDYGLVRLADASILELRVPASQPAQRYTVTVQFGGGQTASAEFTHTP